MPSESSRLSRTCIALLTMALAGCGSGEADQPPINPGAGGASGIGCIQPNFPEDQPDLSALNPPRFLLTTSIAQNSTSGQAQVDPGDPIEAEVTVNGATRRIEVELVNAWSPEEVIYTDEVETPGNQTVPLFLFSSEQTRGRYYMKLTLCGFDCSDQRVIFDMNPDVNSPYERTAIKEREVLQVDRTCIDFAARQGIGSGTILVQ